MLKSGMSAKQRVVSGHRKGHKRLVRIVTPGLIRCLN